MIQSSAGTITRVAGPVVVAQGLCGVRLYDVVHVGHTRLVGEVIRLAGELVTIQVYEDTGGLRVGEPVTGTRRDAEEDLELALVDGHIIGLGDQRPLAGAGQSDRGAQTGGVQGVARVVTHVQQQHLIVGQLRSVGDATHLIQELGPTGAQGGLNR